jgi:hypothetical protein
MWRRRPGAPSVAGWRAPHAARAIVSDPRELSSSFVDLVTLPSRSDSRRFFARTCSPREAFRPPRGSRMRARPRRRESMFGLGRDRFHASLSQAPPDDFCNAYDARAHPTSVRSSSEKETAVSLPLRGRGTRRARRATPRATEVARGAGRELVSEGLARMRAPLLIVAPEHPGRRSGGTKGLETPVRLAQIGQDLLSSSLREER